MAAPIKICDARTIDEIESGKKKIVSKIEYLFNYWTPIVFFVCTLVAGIFWFANAEGRMFSTGEIKYETEANTVISRQRTLEKLDERYVKRDEVKELKETLKSLQADIKELTKELRK